MAIKRRYRQKKRPTIERIRSDMREQKAIWFLYPTKGWRRESWKR